MALPGRAAPDLTGERYGRLVVEGRTKRPEGLKGSGTYWLCRCDCGKKTVVHRTNLTYGKTVSCGCYMADKRADKYDLTGKHMGMLQVMERTERPEGETRYKSSRVWYRCKCDCGNRVTVCSAYLRETLYPNCGCRPKKIHEHQRMIGKGIMPTVMHEERARKEKKLALDALKEDRNERICSQCGKPFDCYAGESWAYKMQRNNRMHLFCGWNCKRKFEREHPARHYIDHGQ